MEETITQTITCPADGEPCLVVVLLSEYLAPIPEQDSIWECLPCIRCRVGLKRIKELKGTRLGRHERRILLSAAKPEEHPKRIAPENETRSADEALRRARRKLERAGLLEGTAETPKRVRLTPAGQALRLAAGDRLATGKPIRWTPRRLDMISEALGSQNADFLFLYFVETLKDRMTLWGRQIERISRVDKVLGEGFEKLCAAADTVLSAYGARQKDRRRRVRAMVAERKARQKP